MKFRDVGAFLEKAMNGFAQLSDAFAVNDAHPQNPARPAFVQIIRYERFHIARSKRVQVQHAINRQLDRFIVHGRS